MTLRIIKGDFLGLSVLAARQTCSGRSRPLVRSRLTRARSKLFCLLKFNGVFIPPLRKRLIQARGPGKRSGLEHAGTLAAQESWVSNSASVSDDGTNKVGDDSGHE